MERLAVGGALSGTTGAGSAQVSVEVPITVAATVAKCVPGLSKTMGPVSCSSCWTSIPSRAAMSVAGTQWYTAGGSVWSQRERLESRRGPRPRVQNEAQSVDEAREGHGQV
jgi:hypothetical protein